MPKNTQRISKKMERSSRKNKGRVEIALSDDSAAYGRVIKKLGFRRFQIVLWDAKTRRLVPDVQATIGKKMVRVEINDIVNVAAADEHGHQYEILALFNGREAARLQKEERIPAHLLVADPSAAPTGPLPDPDAFEFDYDGVGVAEDEMEVVGDDKRAAATVAPDDEDLDIDNI